MMAPEDQKRPSDAAFERAGELLFRAMERLAREDAARAEAKEDGADG